MRTALGTWVSTRWRTELSMVAKNRVCRLAGVEDMMRLMMVGRKRCRAYGLPHRQNLDAGAPDSRAWRLRKSYKRGARGWRSPPGRPCGWTAIADFRPFLRPPLRRGFRCRGPSFRRLRGSGMASSRVGLQYDGANALGAAPRGATELGAGRTQGSCRSRFGQWQPHCGRRARARWQVPARVWVVCIRSSEGWSEGRGRE